MKESDSERELFEEIFEESVTEAVRRQSLAKVVRYSRRRRRCQVAMRMACGIVVMIGLSWLLALGIGRENRVENIATGPASLTVVEGTPIRVISDEELFALFADRSVAMVTVNEQTWFTTLD